MNKDKFFKRISIQRMWVGLQEDKISEHVQYQLLQKTTCFDFIRANEKKSSTLAWTFLQSLVNDDVKVNKTRRISAKIDLELLDQGGCRYKGCW